LLAQAREKDLAKAEKLYNDIRDDAGVCIEMLRVAGREFHQPPRLLLEELFEGRQTKLSRSDIAMLRLARQVTRRCPHETEGSKGVGEGYCWICSTNGSSGQEALLSDLADDLAKASVSRLASSASFRSADSPTLFWADFQPSSALSSTGNSTLTGSRRRVRFAAEVEIGWTHCKEDYPARTMHSPFDPELEFAPAVVQTAPDGLSLDAILTLRGQSMRQLPNLKSFW
jgi:hypothetical protein